MAVYGAIMPSYLYLHARTHDKKHARTRANTILTATLPRRRR